MRINPTNMKKFQIVLLAIVVIISACSKEQSAGNYQTIPVSELSSSVVNYVDENYPDASIVSAVKACNAEATYVVQLNTNEEIAFNAAGNCLGDAEDFNAGASQRGGRGGHGGGHHGGGPGGGGGHNGGGPGGIPIDSLPSAVGTYISTNFSTARIIGARLDSTCQFGNTINVMVKPTNNKPVKLTFDMAGVYLYTSERALYNTVPQIVRDTVVSTFGLAGRFRNRAEKLTLANASVEYNIYFMLNNARKVATVQDNGTIVCSK